MVRGKRADKEIKALEEQKKKVKIEEPETETEVLEDISEVEQEDEESESFKKVLGDFKEDGGWVHVKRKKDGKIETIGKYRPADFDKDEIAKEYGGGTFFYTLRDTNGRIRAKSEETYIDKKEPEKQNNEVLQMAMLIKEQTKEIEALKAELLKPKQEDNTQNVVIEMMKENQRNQVEMLKAIASQNNQPIQQPTSMTEMLTAITTIMTLINKQQPQQPVQQEQKNNISDLVELAGLFADMKANGEPPKQETIMDIIKTFLTDGSLANVISMLKAPKSPMIAKPQNQQVNQSQQLPQGQQVTQEPINNEKAIVQEFFKQYQKQLFQLKVDGGNADYIASTITPFFDLNNDFKTIGYNFFKDKEQAFNGLMEVAVEFKNEQELLKQIVENIHNYFGYNEDAGGDLNGNEN